MDWRLAALQLLSGVGLIVLAAAVPDIRNHQASFATLVSAGLGLITNLMPTAALKQYPTGNSNPPPPLGR